MNTRRPRPLKTLWPLLLGGLTCALAIPAYAAKSPKKPTEIDCTDVLSKSILVTEKKIEKAGGAGIHFPSVSPYSQDGKVEEFYLLTKIPEKADPKSPLFLLRLESTRKLLEDMLNDGVPVVVGAFPEGSGIAALTLGSEYPVVTDALRAGKITNHQNAILIQPFSDQYTFLHEHQHWLDFENPDFIKNLNSTLGPFASFFTQDEMDRVQRIILEVRGHATEINEILGDELKKLPRLDRSGAILKGRGAALVRDYDFELGLVVSAFQSAEGADISNVFTKIRANPAAWAKFRTALAAFDTGKGPKNGLTFAKLLKP